MSKSQLINSASEDENNRTEKSETSGDEYLSDFTKMQTYMNKSLWKSPWKRTWKKTAQEKNHQI